MRLHKPFAPVGTIENLTEQRGFLVHIHPFKAIIGEGLPPEKVFYGCFSFPHAQKQIKSFPAPRRKGFFSVAF